MRIFDAFMLDSELDLLEHRLRETFDLVDVFVLVEAAQTFRGQSKPLVFRENCDRFAWAASTIRHVVLDSLGPPGLSPWRREGIQRNAIMLGLRDADPADIVLILDADEIVARPLLQRLLAEGLDRPHRLSLTRHYEYLDMLAPASACCPNPEAPFPFHHDRHPPPSWDELEAVWYERTPVVVRFVDLCGNPDQALPARFASDLRRWMHEAPTLHDAGRNLVSADPATRTERKLLHAPHTELADERGLNAHHLARARKYGVHHHGWWYAETPDGVLPPDLERLAQRCPAAKRGTRLPGRPMRLLVRTWAWLRFWPRLGQDLVQTVDKHFERLVPVLALPLLVAELSRCASTRWRWRWLQSVCPAAPNPGHNHSQPGTPVSP